MLTVARASIAAPIKSVFNYFLMRADSGEKNFPVGDYYEFL